MTYKIDVEKISHDKFSSCSNCHAFFFARSLLSTRQIVDTIFNQGPEIEMILIRDLFFFSTIELLLKLFYQASKLLLLLRRVFYCSRKMAHIQARCPTLLPDQSISPCPRDSKWKNALFVYLKSDPSTRVAGG